MKASAAKEKASQPGPSRPRDCASRMRASRPARATGPTPSYPKTRVRGSRLFEAAFILAIVELTRRLHQACEQAYDQQAADWLLPQNPERPLTQAEIGSIRGEIGAMVKQDKCQNFINGLLSAAAKETGDTSYSANILDNFDKVAQQGGFHAKYYQVGTTPNGAPIFAAGGSPGGPVSGGTARVELNPNNVAGMNRFNNMIYVALTALHEVMHASGKGFNDSVLAIALAKMSGTDPPKPAQNMDEILARSGAWDKALSDACLIWRSGFDGGKKKP